VAFYGGFPEYVPVAERRRRAARELKKRLGKGEVAAPIVIEGREIATTFWGKAWCEHLEGHADLATRLPRGRTYARNGSVVDLRIAPGEVKALVAGSELYEVRVGIRPLAPARWKAVRGQCAGSIGTVVELLAGRFSSAVMEVLSHRTKGLFPATAELDLDCSCPDGAWLCKHLAAVLYGIGARLDQAPELLFTLRGVDGAELVAAAGSTKALAAKPPAGGTLAADDLGAIFGIEMLEGPGEPPAPAARKRKPRAPAARKPARARGKAKGRRGKR